MAQLAGRAALTATRALLQASGTGRIIPTMKCSSRGGTPSSVVRGFASSLATADAEYDVAIIGGGMVGAGVAAALATAKMTSGLRIAVIDRAAPRNFFDQPPPEFPGLRVSTLTPATTALLQQVGAWEMLAPPIGAAFGEMQVWDDVGPGYVRYSAGEAGAPAMGHVVENDAVQGALLRVLEGCAGVELLMPATVRALELPPYGRASTGAVSRVELEDGRSLRCRLVVGADGARSRTREMAGLRAMGWRYGQHGVVASVRTDAPNSTAWQSFLSTGPLALLPVRDGFSNVVWSTTPAMARHLEGLGAEEFGGEVNAALARGGPSRRAGGAGSGGLLDGVGQLLEQVSGARQLPFLEPPTVLGTVGSSPRSFPLQMAHAGRYVRPRLALVGDAAHAVHPLAGQGVNLGFGDAGELARAVGYALQVGVDIGDGDFLQTEYEAPRQRANISMMAALDGLKGVFSLQAPTLAGARSLGLQLINASPELRQGIMKYAMG